MLSTDAEPSPHMLVRERNPIGFLPCERHQPHPAVPLISESIYLDLPYLTSLIPYIHLHASTLVASHLWLVPL